MSTIEKPTTAVEWDVDAETYHLDSSILGNSAKELFRRKRKKYHAIHVVQTMPPDEPTDDMLLGTFTHVAVLEEDRFDSEFVVAPIADGRTKEGKAIKAAFAAESVGKTIIEADVRSLVLSMRDALYANKAARKLLWGEGLREHTITWTDHDTGILCKSRRDNRTPRYLADLKTCPDVSPEAFAKTILNRGYDRQDAYYRAGEFAFSGEWLPFFFVAVSKPRPHEVAVYELEPDDLDRAHEENRRTLLELLRCRESGDWLPPYEKKASVISLPRYAYNKDYELCAQ